MTEDEKWLNTKLIKDPLHGYISVPTIYMKKIVDTCGFQRLRSIRQTSYDSLYPGSSHNRFIHSIGVFHLGHKAFESFRDNICELNGNFKTEKWDTLRSTFELACLLHDVGHTPFSHSGEDFLLIMQEDDVYKFMNHGIRGEIKQKVIKLYNDLLRVMQSCLEKNQFQSFLQDFSRLIAGSLTFDSESSAPKAHEIMSVIIAIEVYEVFLRESKVDLDLFARSILGVQYSDSTNKSVAVKNVLIQLLNSSIVDVDRLDYIMRDTKMSGFDNVTIDVERLLSSVTLVKENRKYYMAYKKNALSTIENVVLAHDAERRWIQNNPTVLYDAYLVKTILKLIQSNFKIDSNEQGIFQRDALKTDGVTTICGYNIRLLNDGDCIFLMKQIEDEKQRVYVREYLSRDERKRPVWKSESEFRLLLEALSANQKEEFLNLFAVKNEEKDSSDIENLGVFNDEQIQKIEHEINTIEEDDAFGDEDKTNLILWNKKRLLWLGELKNFCEKNDMPFEIFNMIQDPFKSGIDKLSKGVKVWFGNYKKAKLLHHTLNLYQTSALYGREGMKEPVIYWYMYKSDAFCMSDFISFIKETAKKCESMTS